MPRATATTTCASSTSTERDWYLSVEDRRDVIEQPIADDLDVSGWELRKALRLLRKSNPPLLEWLKSPVVYRHDPVFAAEFGALAAEFYSPRRCFAHYLHMAFGNWRDYLRGREEVSLKKYLYVFRPLLACRWIERQLGQVPMLFAQLVESVLDEAVASTADATECPAGAAELQTPTGRLFCRRFLLNSLCSYADTRCPSRRFWRSWIWKRSR